ncbi:type II restriction endonuclease [Oxalobacter vibrioformis]|uniref:site-specific DNA-methyltransferase (adenine-specific) n=1 Tax=Oxalobacter vibrioformis TaxID=933080 RepID=A0A9E9LUJ2_9BURK|nr:type II restriction endonuclease [Oxalobacter vibrioformis]WAW08987.1 type II restriction endonuclease [Oxalobacter vibrioformis]
MENTNTFTNQNLFHTQVLTSILKEGAVPPAHQQILQDWAKNIAELNKQDKTAQHAAFLQKILVDILGYQPESTGSAYTLKDMKTLDSYFDAALGQFEKNKNRMVTLVKLMGPTSSSLDVVSGDEKLSLVQLARQHAEEMPEREFFLLSNLDEVRLYSLMHKRTTYERFSLVKMAEDATEYQRFYTLLNAENMLSGKIAQWLHDSVTTGLQDKLMRKHPTLKDVYGPIQPGPAISINDAFVIDQKTYSQLEKEDPKSKEILQAFYPGDSLKRWHSGTRLHWLIYTPKGKVDIDAYPAVKKYLEQFKETLEKREGDQKWYELDHTENTDIPTTTDFRMGIGRIQSEPGFVIGEKLAQYGNESHTISNADYYLFGLLNSTALSKLITTLARQTDDGKYELQAHHVESLPIPDADGLSRGRVGQIAQFCMEKAQDRRDCILHFQGMTAFNLSPEKLGAKLSDRLLNWFELDFDTFRREIISSFGVDIPANDLPTWVAYFEQEKTNIDDFNFVLDRYTGEMDQFIYDAFGLDEDDIALIEQR